MREPMDENEARAAVLTWCREVMGRAMRGGVQGQPPCRVIDVARSEPDPDRPYQRRDIVYAEGETWRECAGKLGLGDRDGHNGKSHPPVEVHAS